MKNVARFLLALFVGFAGVTHFTSPAFYVSIVPASLPRPELLVQLSGIAELAGAIGLLIPATRRLAGIGLIALFVAVFPANVNMAIHQLPFEGRPVAPALLWGRLFLQPL